MANIKYRLEASEEQLNKLYDAFSVGSPLKVALAVSHISISTWHYWLAISNVARYVRMKNEIKTHENLLKMGIDIGETIEECEEDMLNTNHHFNSVANYREPSPVAILQYKNNKSYKEFADKVLDIMEKCDELRSQIVIHHLQKVKDAYGKNNAKASCWYLERTLPETFGETSKTTSKVQEVNDEEETKVPEIKVEFIDPNTEETKKRVEDMENEIYNSIGVPHS